MGRRHREIASPPRRHRALVVTKRLPRTLNAPRMHRSNQIWPGRWLPDHNGLKGATAVAVLSLLPLLASCGSSPNKFPSVAASTPGSQSTHAAASWPNWDNCLRAHGVAVPAGYDPYSPNGAHKPNASPGVIRRCSIYAPPAPPPSSGFLQRLAATSKCMLAHGFPNNYKVLPNGGYEINYGAGISPQTPGFTSAQRACGPLA